MDKILERFNNNIGGFSSHYLTLYSIVKGMKCKNILEFGCGFSSMTILNAIKDTDCLLTTIDPREIEKTGNTKEDLAFFKKNWNYIQDFSQNAYKKIKNDSYDLVLHDGSHDFFRVIMDLLMISNRVKKNGIVLVHDTEHPAFYLKYSIKIGLIFKRYQISTLPYGNGLSIIRILGNKKLGEAFSIPKK